MINFFSLRNYSALNTVGFATFGALNWRYSFSPLTGVVGITAASSYALTAFLLRRNSDRHSKIAGDFIGLGSSMVIYGTPSLLGSKISAFNTSLLKGAGKINMAVYGVHIFKSVLFEN